MTFKRFALLLAGTSAFVAGMCLLLQSLTVSFQQHIKVAWWSLTLFVFISVVMYAIGLKAAQSPNKYLFNNVIMMSVFFKMLLGVVILVKYKQLYQPDNNFVLPFFFVYVIFTVFETYFMLKLAKMNAPKASP